MLEHIEQMVPLFQEMRVCSPSGWIRIRTFIKSLVSEEFFGTEALVDEFPNYRDHVGWPMLLTFLLRPA